MTQYLIRRILYMIPIVLGVCAITFVLFRVLMGDPTLSLVGKGAQKTEIREVRNANGYDKALLFDFEAPYDRRLVVRDLTEGPERFSIKPVEENPFVDALFLHRYSREGEQDLFRSEDHPSLSEETKVAWVASRSPFLSEAEKKQGAPAPKRLAYSIALRIGKTLVIGATGAETVGEVLEGFRESYEEAVADNPELGGKLTFSLEDSGKGLPHILDSQFVFHFSNLLRLELGDSYQYRQPISEILRQGIGYSLRLTIPIFVLGMYIQIVVAMFCAYKRGTFYDYGILLLSVIGMSFPYLAFIAYAQKFFCYQYPVFPVVFDASEPLSSYALPIMVAIVTGIGGGVRFYRTVFLDEINADYARTARAKGVSEQGVLWKHVFRNALIPIITQVVIAIPFLFLGSLLLESFFGIPGLGGIMFDAINNSDIPVINAMTFIGAVLFAVGVLLTDVCYALVDPRISLQ